MQLYLSYGMVASLLLIFLGSLGGTIYLAWDLSQMPKTNELLTETLELGHQKQEVERDLALLTRRTELLEMYALQAELLAASGPEGETGPLQDSVDESKLSDKLKLRLSWPVAGEISSLYGMRKPGIDREFSAHKGVDIEAPMGAKIFASAKGRVIFAGEAKGYGKMVKIQHGKNIKTMYAHASKVLVKKGRKVNKGQVIAFVGRSGDAKQPHLHFELHYKDVPIDPKPYLK